jgi:hypothetical protein
MIDRDAIRQAAVGARVNSRGYARINCPCCFERVGKDDRKQCMSVNLDTGRFSCFRCHVWGYLKDRQDGEWDGPAIAAAQLAASAVEPPEGFVPLWEGAGMTATCTAEARAYLVHRGIGPDVVMGARIGCCLDGKYRGRVVVPVLDRAGGWLGWVARDWTGRADRKYLNASGMHLGSSGQLFNGRALVTVSPDPALLVEGPFDALAYWPDGMAVLGKPTEAQVATLARSFRPVVVVLDGDAWEEGHMLAMRLRFDGAAAGCVRLPPCVDPDEVDRAWLRDEARLSLTRDL